MAPNLHATIEWNEAKAYRDRNLVVKNRSTCFQVQESSVAMFHRWSSSAQQDQGSSELNAEYKIKELKGAIGPLSGRSLMYCTDACLRRYLEARNWNADKAKKMLEDTLKWRSTYKPEEIRWMWSEMLLYGNVICQHEVAMEGETGKLYRASFCDRQGRSVLILRPGMQNTTSMENQMRHLVYLLENAMLNLPAGQEQMAWLIDFTGWSLTNNVPLKLARETINILQNHYPERLAIAFLYNPPRVFEAFWKIVKYFLDSKTFQKVKFVYPKNKDSVELMRSYFDEENLPKELGGKSTMSYNHEEFSRLMVQDDLKCAAFWGSDDKLSNHVANGQSAAEV
ncbi:Random slug protein 5, partial [Mucuna pruriens]